MLPAAVSAKLEMWGGAECTVNRVGDRSFDQLERTGHARRAADFAAISRLGLEALRVPVLWERVFPHPLADADWQFSDACLAHCRAEGIRPIVGLLHHGSGPRGTDLLDPQFPQRFADYAAAAARRYPWVLDWTPINEPLTTARFSGLYGLWYPHRADGDAFVTALLHQVRAIGLAMQAIREVIPGARLVQTQDLGRATSSPRLTYQRDYENQRRWYSLDLLRGDIDDSHALRSSAHEAGVAGLLDAILEQPCPPDLIGINHYVTSNRHLDDRLEHFPGVAVGGNGRDRYVDVEAVRVEGVTTARFVDLIEETWLRTRTPLVLSEVHLQCSADEQVRWLHEAWDAAQQARALGVDLRAVTAWALFGHVDWHCLLTREENCYAPGAYDVGDGSPRPTALAEAIRSLARTGRCDAPALERPGWWRTAQRWHWHPGERSGSQAPLHSSRGTGRDPHTDAPAVREIS